MEEKVLKEAELICEKMFPSNEVGQLLLHHYLACFAEVVEVVAIKKFRDEMNTESVNQYKPGDVRHG